MIAREKRTVTTHHWDWQNPCCGVSRRGSRLSLGDHDLTSVTVPDRTAPEPKTPKHQHSLNPSTTSLNDTQSRGRPSTIKADPHTGQTNRRSLEQGEIKEMRSQKARIGRKPYPIFIGS